MLQKDFCDIILKREKNKIIKYSMVNLDDINVYRKYDQSRVAESISLLSDQIEQTWVDSKTITLPISYKKGINKIVVNGMGGSNLGFRIISSVFNKELKAPIIIKPGYEVPGFIDSKTLYIMSSYSGNTEEPLSVYKELKKRKAKIAVITSKGINNEMEDIMEKDDIPGFVFDPQNNPSGQPRLGMGYAIFGAAKLLEAAGLLRVSSQTAREIVAGIKGRDPFWSVNVKTHRNTPKKIAYKLHNKTIVLVGSEFLAGNMHTLRNQINENGKNLSFYLISPDMNHYALEGLENPGNLKDKLIFLFFDSDLYNERTRKRNSLAKKLLKQKEMEYHSIKLKSRIKPAQSFEALQFGTWLSFYLALLNETDPAQIPWVDWFKRRL